MFLSNAHVIVLVSLVLLIRIEISGEENRVIKQYGEKKKKKKK
jgi:hypothetical protein